jgi:hypothetical protein
MRVRPANPPCGLRGVRVPEIDPQRNVALGRYESDVRPRARCLGPVDSQAVSETPTRCLVLPMKESRRASAVAAAELARALLRRVSCPHRGAAAARSLRLAPRRGALRSKAHARDLTCHGQRMKVGNMGCPGNGAQVMRRVDRVKIRLLELRRVADDEDHRSADLRVALLPIPTRRSLNLSSTPSFQVVPASKLKSIPLCRRAAPSTLPRARVTRPRIVGVLEDARGALRTPSRALSPRRSGMGCLAPRRSGLPRPPARMAAHSSRRSHTTRPPRQAARCRIAKERSG